MGRACATAGPIGQLLDLLAGNGIRARAVAGMRGLISLRRQGLPGRVLGSGSSGTVLPLDPGPSRWLPAAGAAKGSHPLISAAVAGGLGAEPPRVLGQVGEAPVQCKNGGRGRSPDLIDLPGGQAAGALETGEDGRAARDAGDHGAAAQQMAVAGFAAAACINVPRCRAAADTGPPPGQPPSPPPTETQPSTAGTRTGRALTPSSRRRTHPRRRSTTTPAHEQPEDQQPSP